MLIDFAKFSSVKIGGVFDVMVLNSDNAKDFDGFVIGGANNLLISPKPPKMGILGDEFNQIAIKNGYANENSITMNETQLNAMQKLFDLGFKHGFYSEQICVSDMLIPTEYSEIRNS